MQEHHTQINAFLDALGRRWRRLAAIRLVTRLALGVAVVWAAAVLGWWAIGRSSALAESVVVSFALAATVAILGVAWRRWPGVPSRHELARLTEERVDGFDDRLVTVVDVAADGRVDHEGPIAAALVADTSSRLPGDGVAAVIPSDSLSTASWRAAGALAVALGCIAGLATPTARVARMAWLYVSPTSLVFDVQPGNVRLRPATPLTIRVRASAAGQGLAPDLEVRMKDAVRRARMVGEGNDRFATSFASVPASFTYHVELAGRRSPDYTVTLLAFPRVARIDLTYEFPSFSKLASRSEQDGGDIYAPAGTRVHLTVRPHTTTAPILTGAVALRSGRSIPLTRQPDGSFDGDLVVATDDAYRVRLTDADGLQNTDDPEYFVRMLDDRPPDVRIVRPAGDRQVTPLEEIEIEARADDDHGIAGLDLVYGVRGGRERAVPLGGDGTMLSVTGKHTIYLEDLNVKPGDFVAFYARARDVGRGKRPTQTRSDIYFLEVTPFVDEFALAQSQAMAGSGGQMDDLVRLQKDIIVGTWKLDSRTSRSGAAAAAEDLATLGRAQGNVKRRTEAAAQMRSGGLVLRRPGLAPDQEASPSPLAEAAAAMGRAERALHAQKIPQALPAEMEALNHLLRAQSEAQRKQITRQQANGGGGFNRAQQDLSTLFDRELARQQQTNYETPKTAEERRDDQSDDTLDRVRELARRQEALARQQEDLARDRARMDAEEVKRRLERLTREQSELRREAEMLVQQLQNAERRAREDQARQRGSQSQSGRQRAADGQSGREPSNSPAGATSQSSELREASEDMRNAAGNLRREDTEGAREQSTRALERLQGVERALRNRGPDERRRALGDTQLEARQLADRQRQLTESAADASKRGDADARRRTAGEQQRLAERVDALQKRLRELGGTSGERSERERLEGAARELGEGRAAERMRELARGLQQGNTATQAEAGRELARSLDRLADRLGGSTGKADPEGGRLADDLSRTRELRERLADLQRQMAELGRQGNQGEQGQQTSGARRSQQAGKPSSSGEQQGQSRSPSSAGRGGGQTGTAANAEPGEGGDQAARERARQLGALRQRYLDELRRAGDADGRIRQLAPSTGGYGATPEGQGMVTSAPGTEAFKQDFTKWETLHRELTLGLERLESDLSQRVIDKAAKDRLRSGSADRTPVEYRSSVDKYFRTLAQEPR
jgi:hypothetical protein